ncbi:MAG TPA: hypothetical protein VF434_12750, partial [Promineifilum sp.]
MNKKLAVLVFVLIGLTLLALSLGPKTATAAHTSVVPQPLNITAQTGRKVVGTVTSWPSDDTGEPVENLAGVSPGNDLLVFSRLITGPWTVANVSAVTRQKVMGPAVTHWQAGAGAYLAARGPSNELLVFSRQPGGDWQVENLSTATGETLFSAPASWLAMDGGQIVEHIAGRFGDGRLLVFFRVGGGPWRVVDVTAITGQNVAGPVSPWTADHDGLPVEHLAGPGRAGDLLVFSWASNRDWQVENVSQKTGRKIIGPVSNWQTLDTDNFTTPTNVEHLAGRSEDGSLLVFQRFEGTDWFVTDVTKRGGGLAVAGTPAAYQITDGEGNVKALAVRDRRNSLILYWWKFSRGWQRMNLSAMTGRSIGYDPHAYTTGNEERVAVVDRNNDLLLFYSYSRPRLLTDGLRTPFMDVGWVRSP